MNINMIDKRELSPAHMIDKLPPVLCVGKRRRVLNYILVSVMMTSIWTFFNVRQGFVFVKGKVLGEKIFGTETPMAVKILSNHNENDLSGYSGLDESIEEEFAISKDSDFSYKDVSLTKITSDDDTYDEENSSSNDTLDDDYEKSSDASVDSVAEEIDDDAYNDDIEERLSSSASSVDNADQKIIYDVDSHSEDYYYDEVHEDDSEDGDYYYEEHEEDSEDSEDYYYEEQDEPLSSSVSSVDNIGQKIDDDADEFLSSSVSSVDSVDQKINDDVDELLSFSNISVDNDNEEIGDDIDELPNPPQHSILNGYIRKFDPEHPRQSLKLPTPIITMGFPKAGTSTIFEYFHCGGRPTAHYACKVMTPTEERTDRCGKCIENNMAENRFPLTSCVEKMGRCEHLEDWCGTCIKQNIDTDRPPLEGCGNFDVYTEINQSFGMARQKKGADQVPTTIYFPQVEALEKFHEAYPTATFILNTRNFEHWLASVDNWGILRSRFVKSDITGLPAGVGTDDNDLRNFYNGHYTRIRKFVEDHPSHALVEVDVESDGADKLMEEAFGISSSCWGHANTNTHKLDPSKEVLLLPEKEAVPQHSILNGYVKEFDPDRPRQELKLPTPIITLGFPKAGTSTIFEYFHCGGRPSAHYACKVMTPTAERTDSCGKCIEKNMAKNRFPLSQCAEKRGKCDHLDDWCGSCIKGNIEANRPPLQGCGNFDVYAEINQSFGRARQKKGANQVPTTIYFPQVEALEKFHEAYPTATFILNTRNFEHWIGSVDNWSILRSRFVKSDIRGLPAGVGNDVNDLRNFYNGHYTRVREFVRNNPSHALIEVDVESDSAASLMEEAFGISASCWGHANTNEKRLQISSDEETPGSQTEDSPKAVPNNEETPRSRTEDSPKAVPHNSISHAHNSISHAHNSISHAHNSISHAHTHKNKKVILDGHVAHKNYGHGAHRGAHARHERRQHNRRKRHPQ